MSAPSPLFQLEGVKFQYGSEVIFQDVSLTLPRGQILGLVGPNGSGKTTLLNLLGGLWEERLPAGRIIYHPVEEAACPYDTLSSGQREALRRRRFGFVLQTGYLVPFLSCRDNVALPLLLNGQDRATSQREADRLLGKVSPDLVALADRKGNVSGGEQRCFAVLRAIIHEPDVIFADEPSEGLDSRRLTQVLDMLVDWQREAPARRSLVLVTHNLAEAHRRCDTFLRLGMKPRRLVDGQLREKKEFASVADLEVGLYGDAAD